MFRKALLAACISSVITPAYAANFSYTHAGVGLGLETLEEDLIFGSEVYEDFGIFRINGSYQLADNFAISAELASRANEGSRTEISETSASLSLHFPIAVSDQLDLVPNVGQLSTELELCDSGTCASEDTTAASYGVNLRTWVVPGRLEVTASYQDATAENFQSRVGMGAAAWFGNHHSVLLDLDNSELDSRFVVGYRYTW